MYIECQIINQIKTGASIVYFTKLHCMDKIFIKIFRISNVCTM